MSTEYEKQLEKQNDELKQKLSTAEKNASDRDLAWKVMYSVLRNCNYSINNSISDTNSISINIDGNVSINELSEYELNALKHVLNNIHSKRINFSNGYDISRSFIEIKLTNTKE